MMETVKFDPSDQDGMISLMDRADEFNTMLVGETEDGEQSYVSICSDYICQEVWQSNGHIRKMYYHRDGTIEEMYEGRWDKLPDEELVDDNPDLSHISSSILISELKKRGYSCKRGRCR